MWRSLKDVYEKRSLSGKIFLQRKLMSMKMNEGEKLEEFLSKFDRVLCQLKSSGAEIKEEDVCTLLLALPESYETVVTVLENMATEMLDLNYVKTRLKIESEKKIESGGEQSELVKSAAFLSNKSIRCYNCGESGHIKKYCKKPSQIHPSYLQENGIRGTKSRRSGNHSITNRGNTGNRAKGHQSWNNQSHFRHTDYDQQRKRGDYAETDSTQENSVCFISNRDSGRDCK